MPSASLHLLTLPRHSGMQVKPNLPFLTVVRTFALIVTAHANSNATSCIERALFSSVISRRYSTFFAFQYLFVVVNFQVLHVTFQVSTKIAPKFYINYCCQMLLRGLHIPESISQQQFMQNLGANRVHYGEMKNRK